MDDQTVDPPRRHEPARCPEDLVGFFVPRANAGDAAGLAALYEPDAVLAFPPGHITTGTDAIRQVYEKLLLDRPRFTEGEHFAVLRCGEDLALSSSRLDNGNITVEVARRQPDGSWLWAIDQPNAGGHNDLGSGSDG